MSFKVLPQLVALDRLLFVFVVKFSGVLLGEVWKERGEVARAAEVFQPAHQPAYNKVILTYYRRQL